MFQVSLKYLLPFLVMERKRNYMANNQRKITPKNTSKSYNSCTRHIASLCFISVSSFIEISLTILDIEPTRNCMENNQRKITPKNTSKSYNSCTRHIISLCFISVSSFIEISLTIFRYRADTKLYGKKSNGNNSKPEDQWSCKRSPEIGCIYQ